MFEIPNEELRPEHVPGPGAVWHPTIAEFALSYNGYEVIGNRLPKYAERRFERWRKDGSLPRDLLHLRSCLFMEQRFVWWAEYSPSESPTVEQIAYAHALIDAIRAVVERKSAAEERRRTHNASTEQRMDKGKREKISVVSVERADFRIRDDGVSFHVRPTSEAGRAWIAEHIGHELTPDGGMEVKSGSIEQVIVDIETDGLRFGPHEGEPRIDFFPGESEDF